MFVVVSDLWSAKRVLRARCAWQQMSPLNGDKSARQEREGVLNTIVVDKLAMKNRVSGLASSIELPPPGETICWIPVESSAGALGESPGNQRTIDSGRPTAVTDQATAPSTWSNQPVRYRSPMDLQQVHPALPSSTIPSVPKVCSYFCHISNTPPFIPVPLVSPFVPMFPVSLISVVRFA